jgi:hypothetical protein
MMEANTKSARMHISLSKLAAIVVALIVLIVLGIIYGFNVFRAARTISPQTEITSITQNAFEEKSGLRVQLLAVTAAGGLVDLRLQIVDAEKAKAFLDNHANFPALHVGDDVVLQTSEEAVAAAQDIQIENGKSIFIMFPNTGNVIKPGDPVKIIFGNLQLETIQSQ